MDMIKETNTPDSGSTQRYDIVKELGDCYASVGNYDKAQSCYEKAASLGPDEAGPYVGLGVIAFQQGNIEDSELSFKVACRLDRENSKAYCGLAMIAQHKKKLTESFDLYLKSLEFDNDNLTALLGLFQASCDMGSFSQVIHYLDVYLDMHPGDVTVMFCLAALYFKDNNPEKAKKLLLDVLTLEPDNTGASDLMEEVEHRLTELGIGNCIE